MTTAQIQCPTCRGAGVIKYATSAHQAWGETGQFVKAIKRLRDMEPQLSLLEAKRAIESVMPHDRA